MLQAMRSGTKSPIMKFFLLFLAGGFALWGVGDVTTGLIGGSDKAISAHDVSMSPREVAVEFERTRRNYLPNSSVGEALQSGLLNDVMGALSRDVLFRAENLGLNLTVTREMQRDSIVNEKSFQDKLGSFSEGRFLQALNRSGMSESDYLKRVDGVLMRDQLMGSLTSGTRFDKATARVIASYDLEKRVVRLTSFPVTTSSIPTPAANVLEKFFAENKSVYDAPKLRKVTIASISAQMLANKLDIPNAEIQLAFENRIEEFSKPEMRKIQQMVFDDIEKAKTAQLRIISGEKFVAVAADMLNWTDADTILGTVTKSALDPALADIAFGSEVGIPVGPVETAFGQHVIVVEKIIMGEQALLPDVKQKIIDTLRAEKSIDMLYEKANEFEDAIGSGATIEEAVFKVGGSLITIENVSRNGLDVDGRPITGDGAKLIKDTAVLDLIWAGEINETSVIQEGGDDMFFAVKVNSQSPQKERSLDDVRQRVNADWKKAEAIKIAKASAEVAAKINDDNGTITETFRRNGLGLDHEAAGLIANRAFDLKINSSGVVETGSEAIAIKTLQIIPAGDTEIEETGAIVIEVLNNALREDMLNMVLLSFSESHDLQLNPTAVRQLLVGNQ
ncbi:SurA N-terminal domain-containing protein [Candidatus Puniceispirillum sp.]|nr:SurA N-terminal domain-containing protein [Candidatus Puniceispirillum sp.]